MFNSMKQWEEDRPTGLTDEEAAQLVAEHSQSKDVRYARVVECAGRKHVQLDLKDGDIVTLNKDEAIHTAWQMGHNKLLSLQKKREKDRYDDRHDVY